MIVASKLDRRISIERETTTVDAFRQTKSVWTAFATVRAELVTQSIDELLKPFGEEQKAVIGFRLRHLGSISTKDRLVFEGRFYNICGIQEIGRRQGIELRVEAVS